MADVTVTWEIPYAESTDRLCDGWLYIQEMAERVDEILDAFDVDLAATQVIPLARASRVGEAVQTDVDPGEIIYTAIDFDTTGITNVFTPTAPIEITEEGLWLMGAHLWFDSALSSGTNSMRVNSVLGLNGSDTWRQRVPTAATDSVCTFSYIDHPNSPVDRIYGTIQPGSNVVEAYVWAWRIGDSPL